MKWFIYILLILLVSCKEEPKPEQKREIPIAKVQVVVLKPHKWKESIHSYGIIEAAKEVKIAVEFSAKVKKVLFKEGERVKRGQKLLTFNNEKRKLQVDKANMVIQDAKARLDNARAVSRRTRRLFRQGNISRSEYDVAESDLRQTMAQYEQAITAKRLAMRELKESLLISPVTGLIEKRSVDAGETVLPGQLLGVIQVVATVRVVTYVSEKDINHLRVGSKARVTSAGVPGKTYNARIESLGVKADPRTGNFEVKLTIQNNQGLLRSGMTARVYLEGLEIEDAILIPETAFVDRKRRKVCYKVVNKKAVEIEPVLGTSTTNQSLVLQGLKSGDKLIVGGLAHIIDGTQVEIITEQTK